MTKAVRVILVCIILTFFISVFSDPKLPLSYLKNQFATSKQQTTYPAERDLTSRDSPPFDSAQGRQPTSSFGAILGTSAQSANNTNSSQENIKVEIMKNIIAQDFEEARKRMEEFYQKLGNRQPFDSAQGKQVLGNSDNNLDTIERLSELLTTPKPTLHPKLEKVLAEANNRNYESGITNPAFVPLSGTSAGKQELRIENTYNIGEILANPKKTHYTIALLGDSMVDTLGKELPHLRDLLNKTYPDYTFTLLNYGQGGTDLESGLFRLINSTNYLGEDYPSLLSQKVDILVVESFAYNHWSGQFFDLDRQWITIAKIIDTVKINSPSTKIILAATIAPNTKTFGDGKLNWPKQLKWDSATITKGYLQNVVNFATSEHYPLADAYHPSMDENGDGKEEYINQSDHLHPSNEGAFFFSQKILEAIKQNNLIE